MTEVPVVCSSIGLTIRSSRAAPNGLGARQNELLRPLRGHPSPINCGREHDLDSSSPGPILGEDLGGKPLEGLKIGGEFRR